MKFTRLVPNVFYTDIKVGLKLFIDCLEFTIGYDDLNSDHPFCVLEKEELRINLFQNAGIDDSFQSLYPYHTIVSPNPFP